MYTIKEIKAILTDFYEFKTSDTPSALSDIMESVQNLYTQYNKSSKDSEKKNCFNALNEYMKQYDSMKWILENLERSASKKHPDYTINHYRDDNSTEIESISGDIIVEDMLEKVHIRSELRNPHNEMHRIIRYTVGWWYDNNDAVKNVRQYMIRYAVGEILDAFAEQYGFTREEGESDESLRNRLLAHFRELFRKDYVTNNNNMKIYTKLQHGNPHENLTSTNTYLSNDYYIYAPDKIRDYWSNKYITWRDIIWL